MGLLLRKQSRKKKLRTMTIEMTDERKNKPSMSRLYRLAHCPGSWGLELGQRGTDGEAFVEKTTPWAETGTRIHAALEGTLDPETLNPEEGKVYSRCMAELDEALDTVFGNETEDLEIYREERLWYGDEEISGQPDVVVIHGDTCLIADYKTGRGEVEHARENYQLRGLAVAAWKHYGGLSNITVCIIQPLAEGDNKLTMARYEVPHLEASERELKDVLTKINNPDAVRVPGFKQCQYCPSKYACPEALEEVNIVSEIQLVENQELSVRMPELLDKCKVAEQVIKGIRERAFEILEEDPRAVDGWHLKTGATRQIIRDIGGVFQKLKDNHGIDAGKFASNCSIGKSKIKKLIADASGLKGKELDDLVSEALDGHVTYSQNKPSLAKLK